MRGQSYRELVEELSMPENSKGPEVSVHRIEGSQCGCEQGAEGSR